jgi:transcriptional regulator with XRE-family HTH domain
MEHRRSDPAKLAARLRKWRQRAGLTIPELIYELATAYGIERTRQNIYQHEKGLRIPGPGALGGYCRVYNLNTAESRELYELAGLVVIFAVEEG